jgi:hypothetical protein
MGKKLPLEWKMDTIETSDATVTNGRIALGLRDDQIAEVHKVHSYINGGLAAGVDDTTVFDMMLSMDPDIVADPSVPTNHEDLEIFFRHSLSLTRDLTTSGQSDIKNDSELISDFDPPVLVGTDVGQVVTGDAAIAGSFWTRVYFTRRKATAQELNQVLLKRR